MLKSKKLSAITWKPHPDYLPVYLIVGIVVKMLMFFLFKWLGSSWDKSVITKMARNGKITLANIVKRNA